MLCCETEVTAKGKVVENLEDYMKYNKLQYITCLWYQNILLSQEFSPL